MAMNVARRRRHVARLPLLLVLLLAGQRKVLGGAGVSSEAAETRSAVHQTVVDASGKMESIEPSLPTTKDVQEDEEVVVSFEVAEDDIPEITPEEPKVGLDSLGGVDAAGPIEACVDVTLVEEEREALRAKLVAAEERVRGLEQKASAQETEHASKLDTCGGDRVLLEKEVETLAAELGQLGGVLERAGGEEGIRGLIEAAVQAEDANERAERLKEQMEKEKKDAEREREEVVKTKDEAKREKEEAVKLAREMKVLLQSKLDAAQEELEELRGNLSSAEVRASEAREEAGRHAQASEEVVRKLERTESQLKEAKLPRQVSVKDIAADVAQLGGDLMEQSAAARDDIVDKASEYLEQARVVVQPYWDSAVVSATPILEKATEATKPQRAQAHDAYVVYRGKFEDNVATPVIQKYVRCKEACLTALTLAWTKWQEMETVVMQYQVRMGMSHQVARKSCKFLYMGLMAVAVVFFLYHLGGAVIRNMILPAVRTKLRLAVWIVKLPFRVLFLPVRLVWFVLTLFCRLIFGRRDGGGGGASPKTGAKTGTKRGKKGTPPNTRK